jgi:transposase
MAVELSEKSWRLGFSDGRHGVRHVAVVAGDTIGLMGAIAKAKERFRLEGQVRVVSCYEAGRDGFWLHRFLVEQGVENLVVDSASIEVDRRARRAKTDRLDVDKLVEMLKRYCGGERRVWRVVRVPTVAQEDARRMHREMERLKRERTQHSNRIRSLLVLHNVRVKRVGGRGFEKTLAGWAAKLPRCLGAEIRRQGERLRLVEEQLAHLEAERKAQVASGGEPEVVRLGQLYGVGLNSAWVLVHELFGWRTFGNRREVGGAVGLTGTPYTSGESEREQGITKAGNKRVRWLMVQLSWSWLRYQPHSALAKWFNERFGVGKRQRRIGIVAVARRLLIDLWRYLEQGVIPAGAKLRAA